MMSNNLKKPTDSELDVLKILWENGPSTVREVNDKLNLVRQVGYTTTLKIMQIMSDKSLVERDTSSRTHIYKAAIDEMNTQTQLLKKFVDNIFRGSASQLVMQALGSHKASSEELNEIKLLIEQIENKTDKPN